MKKAVAITKSFQESDQSDKAYYHGLTPRERLEILLELNRRWPMNDNAETSQRLERIYRVIKLS